MATGISPRFVAPRARPTVAAATAAEALASAGIPPRLDAASAWALLAHAEYSTERSFFADVGIVPLGESATMGPDGVVRVLPPPSPPPRSAPFPEAARLLRSTAVAAVRAAVEGASRVGVLLSGGLDSSALAAATAEAWRSLGRNPADARAYHGLPLEGEGESSHAEAVARRLGMSWTAIRPASGDFFVGGDEALRRLDVPVADGGLGETVAFLRRLRDDGVDLVLTGDGGDEAFGGAWMRPWRRPTPSAAARALAVHALKAIARPVRDALTGSTGRAHRKARALGVPAWLLALRPGPEETRTRPHDRPGLSRAACRRDRAARCARQAVIVASWEATTAAAGLRAAFPWLDPHVLDLCLAVPQRHFVPEARDKRLLRAAFADRLPDAVATRAKDGEPATEHQRAFALEFGRTWWERQVRGGALERAGLAPPEALADLLARVRTGGPGDVFRFLGTVSLGAWCRARGL